MEEQCNLPHHITHHRTAWFMNCSSSHHPLLPSTPAPLSSIPRCSPSSTVHPFLPPFTPHHHYHIIIVTSSQYPSFSSITSYRHIILLLLPSLLITSYHSLFLLITNHHSYPLIVTMMHTSPLHFPSHNYQPLHHLTPVNNIMM